MPILRDTEQSSTAFKLTGIPTMFILDANGMVQDCDVGANPRLAEILPAKLDKVLAGENIYQEPLKAYLELLDASEMKPERKTPRKSRCRRQSARRRRRPRPGRTADHRSRSAASRGEDGPAEPAGPLKLTPLWKCADLKSPGNILVPDAEKEPAPGAAAGRR